MQKIKLSLFKNQEGIAAIYLTLLVLTIVFAMAATISILTYNEQKISRNITKSLQAYYVAEAGAEDALLRLVEEMNWLSTYTLDVDDDSATITISDITGGTRTITSEGEVTKRTRKVQVNYGISSEQVSFHYGAQVGEGGIQMDDGSTINGNVFSNGNIIAANNTEITGTVRVAKTGNKIQGATIGEDAFVDICEDSDIIDTLTCTTNINCTASLVEILTEEIATSSFPITQEKIDEWKIEAATGGTIVGDYTLSGNQTDSLGPKKIEGDMTIQNQAQLSITGTIWITGRLTIQDIARVSLDESAYGGLSGVMITDGIAVLQNLAEAIGSGVPGSYLIIISTDSGTSAITVQDDFEADILYTHNGWLVIQNTANVREVTGYGIHLKNNAEITYEVGLEDVLFSSGPGGSWEVNSWKEIE